MIRRSVTPSIRLCGMVTGIKSYVCLEPVLAVSAGVSLMKYEDPLVA